MADMANLALESHLESLIEESNLLMAGTARQVNSITGKSTNDYTVITQRNIFNSKKKPLSTVNPAPLASPGLPTPVQALPPLDLILIGTVVSDGIPPYAVIKDPKEKKQILYRNGDSIGGLFANSNPLKPKIVEIDRNKVVLLRGGQKEVLKVKKKPKKKQRTARRTSRRNTPSKPSPGETIRKVSDNQWLLDRRELDNAIKNLPQLLTKARVIPSFKDGKPDGFRIFAIARNSLYSKIGLQNGDILHRINGVDIKNPQNFMQVVGQLKDESAINIDLVRSNQKRTFNYEIR